MTNDLIISSESWVSVAGIEGPLVLPEVIASQGDRATSRYVEFFARIENENTRIAYLRAAGQFFAWCEVSALTLSAIQPVHVAAYREVLKKHYAAPTIKQHLAAIRRLFDELVVS
jgi:integrase/recombinase XerD